MTGNCTGGQIERAPTLPNGNKRSYKAGSEGEQNPLSGLREAGAAGSNPATPTTLNQTFSRSPQPTNFADNCARAQFWA